MSLINALRISTGSIQLNQSALGTISHNVSNINSENYSRQTLNIGTQTIGGQAFGAQVNGIQRNVDNFLLERIDTATSDVAYNETRRDMLNTVEAVLNVEPSLGGLVNGFFEQLNILAASPDSASLRQNVVQSADRLADTFNNTYQELTDTANEADNDIDSALSTVNQILSDIAQLNGDIAAVESGGNAAANDLRDQRQAKVNELSTYFKLNSRTNSDGTIAITTENGRNLVNAGNHVKLERVAGGGTYDDIGIRNILADGSEAPGVDTLATAPLTGGSIKAMIDVRDTHVSDLQAELDELATTFMTQFNLLHSHGSSVPPQNSLTSAVTGVAATTDNLYTDVSATLEGATFNVSVVNATTGAVISTTAAAGGGAGPITLTSPGPFSLDDLDTLLSGNADVGGDLTVSTTVNSSGDATITVAATNASYAIVLDNVSGGDVTGLLQFNNFFSGTGANDMAVRSAIANDPTLIATAQMRASDGGLSFLDNQNIITMASATDTDYSFSAAGELGAETDTLAGYANSILSTFAMTRQDIVDRLDFDESILTDVTTRSQAISGVNLDEELANMLLFQRSFQASAQMIGVVDEMMQTLISLR